MLWEATLLGVITLWKTRVEPFSDRQVELVTTFADQAVIAIENVRLFTELQAKNQALTTAHSQVSEALEQQTATSEILRVISSSPTAVQPTLEAIARAATVLCEADIGGLFPFDGELIHLGAQHGRTPEELEASRQAFPQRPSHASVTARAILAAAVVQISDVSEDPEAAESLRIFRTVLAVPMIREGRPLGAITVGRRAVRLFTDKQIELLKTFADQAVIAIENVRLFNETREALEQQTATSEILAVMSQSQTDAQPVFEAIVRSALRLCDGFFSIVYRFDGEMMSVAADHQVNPRASAALRALYPAPARRDHIVGRALLDRRRYHITDVATDPELGGNRNAFLSAFPYRTALAVPMLRGGVPIGAIAIGRNDVRPFTDRQIEVLETFADQAVIAIENARLLGELQSRTGELTRSVGELRALGEVGQAISSTLDLQTVLSTIVARATELSGTDAGVIYEYDEQREVFVPRATAHLEIEIVETMLAAPVRRGEGATGRLAEVPEPIQLPDILEAPAESRVRGVLVRAGYRALLAVPLVREDHLIGGLTVFRKAPGEFAPTWWNCSRHSPPNRPWPSRTLGYSWRSRTRVGSSKRRASTRMSSWPTCRTSCAPRSTPSSAFPRC